MSLVDEVLEFLYDVAERLPRPLEAPYQYVRRIRNIEIKRYRDSLYQMRKQGLIEKIEKNGRQFLQITQKGQLQVLFKKARIPHQGPWDGKWRLIIFDIPEATRTQRDILRRLLKQNEFLKLQASVFISPYEINMEAVEYLKQVGLNNFIHILRIDKMDNEDDLKKRFNLK